jgi:hypothetical protein
MEVIQESAMSKWPPDHDLVEGERGKDEMTSVNLCEALEKRIEPPALKRVAIIRSKLSAEPDAVIESAGGLRLKVRYADAPPVNENDEIVVVTRAALEGPPPLPGRIKSGADWIFVRNDGVIFVDARVTIRFVVNDDPRFETKRTALVDATIKGTIDLTQTFGVGNGRKCFELFKTGTAPLTEAGHFVHMLSGSLRFEAGDGRDQSGDLPDWLSDHMRDSAELFENFAPLVRQQFFVTGFINVDATPRYNPTAIHLEAWGF